MAIRVLPGLAVASLLLSGTAFAQNGMTSPSTSQSAAQRLSLTSAAPVRAGAATAGKSNVNGGTWGWIVGAVGLVAGVTYALVEGDDDDEPASN